MYNLLERFCLNPLNRSIRRLFRCLGTDIVILSVIISFAAICLLNFVNFYLNRTIIYRLQQDIYPTHYDVKLMVSKDDYFNGKINISMKILTETDKLSFHTLSINHHEIELSDENHISHKVVTHVYDSEYQIHTIYFPNTLEPGNYFLHITFSGIITDDRTDGFYRIQYAGNTEESDADWSYVANFRAKGARRIFPCWDQPEFTSTFKIAIKHPPNTVASSNMQMTSRHVAKNDIWTSFETIQSLSPCLITFMIYNNRAFVSTPLAKDVNVLHRNHTNQHLQFARLIVNNVVRNLRNLIKSHILQNTSHNVSSTLENKMESLKHVLFRGEDIMYDKNSDPISRKMEVAHFITHELSRKIDHMFIPLWWSYFWINEGLSTMIGINALEKVFSTYDMTTLFIAQAQHECFRMDDALISYPLNQLFKIPSKMDFFFFSQYHLKAYLILRMLRHAMTPKLFWHGLCIYFDTFQDGLTTPEDLWTAMQRAVIQSPDFAKIDIKKAMHAWTHTVNYPIIEVNQDDMNTKIYINPNSTSNIKWFVPVNAIMKRSAYYITYKKRDYMWLTPNNNSTIVMQTEYDWIIVNVNQFGYYRVNYEQNNWIRIADFLKTNKYEKIPILTRAQLISDAYYFAMRKKLELSVFFELTEYLTMHEANYIAWYPMIKALEYMSGTFPYANSAHITNHACQLLTSLTRKLGFRQKLSDSDLTIQLREEAIKWACVLNTSMCTNSATIELNRYLNNPSTYKLRPGWKEWTHCKGLMSAKTETWHLLFHMWLNKKDNKTLEYFACSENYEVIYKYLRPLPLDYTYHIMPHYHTKSFLSIIARHARQTRILCLILNHFKEIKPRAISTDKALTILINYIYSVKQLNMVLKVIGDITPNKSLMRNKIKMRFYQIKKFRNTVPKY